MEEGEEEGEKGRLPTVSMLLLTPYNTTQSLLIISQHEYYISPFANHPQGGHAAAQTPLAMTLPIEHGRQSDFLGDCKLTAR